MTVQFFAQDTAQQPTIPLKIPSSVFAVSRWFRSGQMRGVSASSRVDLIENLQNLLGFLISKLLPVFVGALVRPIG